MRKDALKNRQRIEDKALELFKSEGVNNVSMNRISKELNIGMGTLYRHFKDKSDLCYRIIEHDFDDIMNQMLEIKSQYTSRTDIMAHSLDIFLKFKTDNSDLLNCIEGKDNAKLFRSSNFFKHLNQYYFDLFNDYGDEAWAIFKTDMLLKSLTTNTFEFQKNERQLTNETFRNNLIKLYLPNEVTQ
ncbi:TetR/AcrR family transcriptional regulator [Staphylococcus haemolyticus]|uniref:TetR/AcrR family transcriptional regulator n=1 Tax=Staphylococcus haemolyticus TaxID=1283 RepID=UPI00069FD40A|nr:TetR/AcrR family transcriptional regulator [Staphylococcus haemolyticus]MCE5022028.1 TetR/AcrR family transcriptional regulator [Staphylococcus haemolyticus]PTK51213.1 TetR/AcrR family transcriptional regulator [Staphylococcus haemolyticus]PTK68096.1 TetR/AcrR family transcriptional regulator [Staphylococcus haemolyticus]PTK73338.1 TetR/AcrR family transcriptional regulator [Staphylococcus haemolyticus]PTL03546.1 TetR/AcrR family transcriptional regulator [Staphylococcus haemolyticus]